MHGGAVTLAQQFNAEPGLPDLILATDMLDVTTFRALSGVRLPIALYMHENQLTYPLPDDGASGPMRRQLGERDLHYAFINYVSMLASDRVFFNSGYHRESFFAALPNFLRHFPEYNELDSVASLEAKSAVLPVGVRYEWLRRERPPAHRDPAPLVLWNQRWEYDKNPAAFFDALYAVQDAGIPFRLALCGENFRRRPQEFEAALERLAPCIVHAGYAPQEQYRAFLWEAEVTVSTALHEFFGISVLEAVACESFPLLPNRLSYPKLLPERFHPACLYTDQDSLVQALKAALTDREQTAAVASALAGEVARYDWGRVAGLYDDAFAGMIR
jgi:glycosyltransferase involved in cell wall biosynthesis